MSPLDKASPMIQVMVKTLKVSTGNNNYSIIIKCNYITKIVGQGSSVGIATRYRLDGPRVESQWGARFSTSVQTGTEAHPASYTMGTRSFPGVNWPGCNIDHPPPSSAKVTERVALYLYSPSETSWSVLRWIYFYMTKCAVRN